MEVHKDYPCHVDNYQRGRAQPVSFLVFHYVGATGGAEANAKYYGRTPGIGASAHYFVDHAPNAEVWASVDEGDTAWHCGAKSYRHPTCRNANSIGIEMCCHLDAKGGWYIDEATMAAAAELGRDIMTRYGIPWRTSCGTTMSPGSSAPGLSLMRTNGPLSRPDWRIL